MVKKQFFSPWEGVKVGNSEIFSKQHMLVDCEYLFFIDLLALKFETYVINIENLLFQKFHGKKKKFQSLGSCQSWQQ